MRFAFVSGNAALDLVGTVGYRRDEPVDLLDAPAALEQWVLECEELPDRVTADAADLAFALRLREAVHRLALDRLAGRPFAPAELDVVNSAAAGPVPAVELGDGGLRRSGDLRSALVQVARGAIAVLADRSVPLKECGRAGCTRLYLDRSRGARRTWCGMDACGNRVKAAAYRARRQAARQGPGADESRAARREEPGSDRRR
ncbi:ABATE domain-containing protein [Streptomyces sp. WMMB303]|uniref:CGNR zinc finger domain-containing protein n=1 Tax=unclassified Streptomyces TaxID=2593676 RepID=UPI0023EB0553|nr:ABATE domain-containing protein [Streptomyces sp. WMMB303]MDF4248901.1 CGNR zinc finger domain-containing protein [Streptomyces sp. WMMB303]